MGGAGVAAVAALAMYGCDRTVGPLDRRAFVTADSWFSPPDGRPFTPLPPDQFAVVVPSLQGEAQSLLVDAPARVVAPEEAARLAGRPLPGDGVRVLLRGVALNEGTGQFQVLLSGPAVHVHHGCLGRRPAPMVRRAVVAVLPSAPEVASASCSMAQ